MEYFIFSKKGAFMRRTCRDKHEESSLKNLQKACKSSVVKINKYIGDDERHRIIGSDVLWEPCNERKILNLLAIAESYIYIFNSAWSWIHCIQHYNIKYFEEK
jgi:hypothetical protein